MACAALHTVTIPLQHKSSKNFDCCKTVISHKDHFFFLKTVKLIKYVRNGDGLDPGNGVYFSILHFLPLAHCRVGASEPREPYHCYNTCGTGALPCGKIFFSPSFLLPSSPHISCELGTTPKSMSLWYKRTLWTGLFFLLFLFFFKLHFNSTHCSMNYILE